METTDRIEQLAEEIENQPSGVALGVYPARIPVDSLAHLALWCDKLEPLSACLANWLRDICVAEVYRRSDVAPPTEVAIPRMPIVWTNHELADAVEAGWLLAFSNTDRCLDDFLKEVVMHLTTQTASRLRKPQ